MPHSPDFSAADLYDINELQRKNYNAISRSPSLQLGISNIFDGGYKDNAEKMDGKFAQRVFKLYGRRAYSYGWNKKMQEENLPITNYKAFNQKSDPANWITTKNILIYGLGGIIAGLAIALFLPTAWTAIPVIATPIVTAALGSLVAYSDRIAVKGFIQKGYEDASETIERLDGVFKDQTVQKERVRERTQAHDVSKQGKTFGKHTENLANQRAKLDSKSHLNQLSQKENNLKAELSEQVSQDAKVVGAHTEAVSDSRANENEKLELSQAFA